MNRSFVALAAAMAFLAGCNTMQGVGKDISAGGQKVEDVLKKDKPANDSNASTPANPEGSTSGSSTDPTARMPANSDGSTTGSSTGSTAGETPAAPADTSASNPSPSTSTQ